MKAWKRSNKLRAHIDEHIKWMTIYTCIYPMCQEQILDEMGLRYHMSDAHGSHRAIWDKNDRPTQVFKEGQEHYSDIDIDTFRKKRPSGQRMGNCARYEQQKKRARGANALLNDSAQIRGLRINQWKPSSHAMWPTEFKPDIPASLDILTLEIAIFL
jgi:hypothetical protein